MVAPGLAAVSPRGPCGSYRGVGSARVEGLLGAEPDVALVLVGASHSTPWRYLRTEYILCVLLPAVLQLNMEMASYGGARLR